MNLASNVIPTSVFSPGSTIEMSQDTTAQEQSIELAEDSLPLMKCELFGGSITMLLPATFEDISKVREVPDHQEVYVDKLTDMSIIVEILNHESTVKNEDAAKYHFDDLAGFNEVITDVNYLQ
jgi:hypothetical protein